jgi:hypothetical protein
MIAPVAMHGSLAGWFGGASLGSSCGGAIAEQRDLRSNFCVLYVMIRRLAVLGHHSKKAGMTRLLCCFSSTDQLPPTLPEKRPPRLVAVLSYGPECWVICGKPLVKAHAIWALPTVRLKAAKAARIKFFSAVLHLKSRFDGRKMDVCRPNDNAALEDGFMRCAHGIRDCHALQSEVADPIVPVPPRQTLPVSSFR